MFRRTMMLVLGSTALAAGLEKNSRVISSARDVLEDEKSDRLFPRWKTAGREGNPPKPEDITSFLGLSRYGPSAIRPRVAKGRDGTDWLLPERHRTYLVQMQGRHDAVYFLARSFKDAATAMNTLPCIAPLVL